jgi:hypothetical protein
MMGWVRTSKILSAKFGGREHKTYFKLLGKKHTLPDPVTYNF